MFRSLQSRLTISFVAIVTATALALALGLTVLFNGVLLNQYAATYRGNADATAAIMDASIGQNGLLPTQLQPAVALLSKRFHVRIRIYTYADSVLVADSEQDATAAVAAQITANLEQHLALDHFGSRMATLYSSGHEFALATLVVSDPLTDRAYVQQQFVRTVAWILPGALLLALVIGGVLAARLTGPLRVLTRATVLMAEGNLAERVPERCGAGRERDEVGELTRQFNRMAERLEESFMLISADRDRLRQFVADVSHEVRTPLTALRTFNDLLQDGAGSDPETRRDFLAESARQIDRLDWLTHNLLDLSRLDAGLTRLTLRPADLCETVRRAVEANRPAAGAREVALVVKATLLLVAHDPPRLEQALSNVIGNAIKFSPHGCTVHVQMTTDDEQAVVEIRDEGPGIPEDEAPHVFDRFYRGRDANRAGEGSGLGLAIARAIVEAHGGTIAVATTAIRGATLRIALPRAPNPGETTTATYPHTAMTPAP